MAAGALLTLAHPPVDAGPLAFVALVPLVWAIAGAGVRQGALAGLLFGLAYYGILLRWLLPFGAVAWLPVTLTEAAFATALGALAAALWRADRPLGSALAFAAAWTAVDWARGNWPLGGFSWGALAYTQHDAAALLRLASVTGMWGVTFVVAAVNALGHAFVAGLAGPRAGGGPAGSLARPAVVTGAAAALVLLPGLLPLPAATGPPLDVAVVQGNVPRELAHDRLLQTEGVAANHIRLHRRLAPDPPDLAVWPENALADDPAVDRRLGAEVSASIAEVGSPTLVGALSAADERRLYNQVLLYDGEGRIRGRYSKVHLVPGGEYIPFEALLGWAQRYRLGNAVLAPGRDIRLFRVAGVEVGTPICFENVFPDLFRRFVARGARIVVLTTNDSSFLESEASRQHVAISQVRAVETGRWVVQAAISGESAIVDPTGRVHARTGLFEQRILRASVPTSSAVTAYVRFGDWFPWACALAVLVALAWMARRRPDAPPAGEQRDPSSPSERRRTPLPIAGGAGPRVLVVLPTYNERETVARVITGVLAAGPRVDALVVDDNSPDGTGKVVAALAESEPRVRLIERSGKLGLASAYLLGFRLALEEGYDVVVEMDSDLSHQPDELPRLLEATSRHDVTVGSRYVPGGAVTNWSRARLGVSKAGNAYARLMLRVPVHDATSGYRAYRREALAALLDEGIRAEGYAFQIELVHRASRLGFRVGEVPITFREREHGRSKFSKAIVLEALLKVSAWGLRDRLDGHRQRRA